MLNVKSIIQSYLEVLLLNTFFHFFDLLLEYILITNFSFFTFLCEIENTDPSKTYLSPRIWKGQLQKVFLDKLPSVNARWWWTALRSLFWHVIVSWLGKLIWRVLSLNIRDHIHALHVVGDAEAESVVGRGGHLGSAGAQVSLSQPREETWMAGFWTKFLVGQRVTQAHNLVRAIIKDCIKNCRYYCTFKQSQSIIKLRICYLTSEIFPQ